jgi:hypothetical protein
MEERKTLYPGMVVHTCNPNTQEAEEGRSWDQAKLVWAI